MTHLGRPGAHVGIGSLKGDFQVRGACRDLLCARGRRLRGGGEGGEARLSVLVFLIPSDGGRSCRLGHPGELGAQGLDFGALGILDKADKINPDTNQPLATVQDDLNLRASAGISIFWKSPMGPLRFDFSQIIKKDHYDVTELFRFSTSTRF